MLTRSNTNINSTLSSTASSSASGKEEKTDTKEHKHENNDQKNQRDEKLSATKTKGWGDCAFHSALGKWNHRRRQYECPDVDKPRMLVAKAIRDSKPGSEIYSLAMEGIKAMIMDGRGGREIQGARNIYEQAQALNSYKVDREWNVFKKKLIQYPDVMSYIKGCLPEEKNDIVNINNKQFNNCLNKNDGELYGIILSIPELNEAFESYKDFINKEFQWNVILNGKGLIEEYADYIGKSGNWLLPLELNIIAHALDITIEFYTVESCGEKEKEVKSKISPVKIDRFVATYNPGKINRVAVRFNGSNHYEKMEDNNMRRANESAGENSSSHSSSLSLSDDDLLVDMDDPEAITEVVNPFLWQIKKQFSGTLKKIEHLTEEQLDEYLEKLVNLLHKPTTQLKLAELEQDVKDFVADKLKKYLQRKMAYLILGISEKRLRSMMANCDNKLEDGKELQEQQEEDEQGEQEEQEEGEDEEEENEVTLESYFTYRLWDDVLGLIRSKATIEGDIPLDALTNLVDKEFFKTDADYLWQTYIQGKITNLTDMDFYDTEKSSLFLAVEKGNLADIYSWRQFLSSSHGLAAQLKTTELWGYFEEITRLENHVMQKTMPRDQLKIVDLEKARPGAFIKLLKIIAGEKLRLRLAVLRKEKNADEALNKLNEFIFKNEFKPALEMFEESDIDLLILKLNTKLEQYIESKRLHLYVSQLRSSARKSAETYLEEQREYEEKEWEKYLEEKQEIDDDPQNADYDFDGIVYPAKPSQYYTMQDTDSEVDNLLAEHFYSKEEFDDLMSLENLITICRGENSLGWLINQVAEYDLEIPESVLGEIDYEALSLDGSVAEAIIYSLCMYRYYSDDITSGNFIREAFSSAFKKLKDGSLTEDFPALIDGKKNPLIFNKKSILDLVKKNFAKFKKLVEMGKLKKLQEDYNLAYQQNDMIQVQRLWAIFTKFQRLLNSSAHLSKKSRIAKKGEDYDLLDESKGCDIEDYDGLLAKAYASYEARGKQYYYKIYPVESTRFLVYPTKSDRAKPHKYAKCDLFPLLSEIQDVGRMVKEKLKNITEEKEKKRVERRMACKENKDVKESSTKKRKRADNSKNDKLKDDSVNVVVPVLCFVVTTKPHIKGGDHGRVFVPVSFDLSRHVHDLLSKDLEDGIFTGSDEYFYNAARRDYHHGCALIWGAKGDEYKNEIASFKPVQKSNLLHHSERVLFEALRKGVKDIVRNFKRALARQLNLEKLEQGEYKIYSLSLLLYSTNSVCDYCGPSIVSLQNSHEDGFLKLLIEELYSLEDKQKQFKVRGYSKEKKDDPAKFNMLTIVASDRNFTEQANDMSDDPVNKKIKKPTVHHNPKAKVYYPNNAINLKAPIAVKDGVVNPQQRTFIEFVKVDFASKGLADFNKGFVFTGKTFMSGSKIGVYKKQSVSLDKSVKALLDARRSLALKPHHDESKPHKGPTLSSSSSSSSSSSGSSSSSSSSSSYSSPHTDFFTHSASSSTSSGSSGSRPASMPSARQSIPAKRSDAAVPEYRR